MGGAALCCWLYAKDMHADIVWWPGTAGRCTPLFPPSRRSPTVTCEQKGFQPCEGGQLAVCQHKAVPGITSVGHQAGGPGTGGSSRNGRDGLARPREFGLQGEGRQELALPASALPVEGSCVACVLQLAGAVQRDSPARAAGARPKTVASLQTAVASQRDPHSISTRSHLHRR